MAKAPSAPSVRNSDPAVYAFIYGEALRGLTQQEGVLTDLRGRAGILLAAAAVATSFLGGIAFNDQKVGRWGVGAIVAFIVVGGLVILVLWPRRKWAFRWNAEKLLSDYAETTPPMTLAQMHRALTRHGRSDLMKNETRIERLWLFYRLASIALVVEIVCWLMEVGGG